MAAVRTAAALAAGAIGLKVLDTQTQVSSDLAYVARAARAARLVRLTARSDDYTIVDIWEESVKKWHGDTMIIFEHRRLSFGDMDVLSTQMAHWLLQQGIKRGETVALMMENKPEFVAWWLALAKIGVRVALINHSIKQKALIHCITLVKSAGVIFDAEMKASVHDVAAELQLQGVKFLFWGSQPRLPFDQVCTATHDILLGYPRDSSSFRTMRQGLKMNDIFGYVYTSGTTGLPKAANISHLKLAYYGNGVVLVGLSSRDNLYICLPLYHSSGGIMGVVGCIFSGATAVLARKFSSKRFWSEILAHECTAFLYIGELGRYLVNYAKEHPEVCSLPHKLKVAMGNGLRREVWDDFQDGFRIPLICEIYGATEGNGGLMNFCHRGDRASRGACGRTGLLARRLLRPTLVRFDVERDAPVRGPDGLCVECGPGEAGELLFVNGTDPLRRFQGYTDEKATAKKLLSGVRAQGDSWVRTGDLLYRDRRGLWYFVDRIGDTFRWKGENCSTMEVSEVISSLADVAEANVYGVKVPGNADGRACTVAIAGPEALQTREGLDAIQLLCERELPVYARPLFVRFLPQMEITVTFKHQKVNLREQGCDPRVIQDPLYWLSPATKRYEKFELQDFLALENGRSKL